MSKQLNRFAVFSVFAIALCLSSCSASEPEWYDSNSKVFTSELGYYKANFPTAPKKVLFEEYGDVKVDAWECISPDLKLVTTYRNDTFPEAQYGQSLGRAAEICLNKFNLIETMRTPWQSGSDKGVDIQGKSQKSDDIFLLRIIYDPMVKVDHILLMEGKPTAVNGDEGKKFLDSFVLHRMNYKKKNPVQGV